ncbi:MAG: hypothetical protein ACOCU6_00450, partial [Nanoarchaeota archaeon]
IIGVVVEKTEAHSFMLDDGTGTISVTDFNRSRQTRDLEVGDPVLVIGKPRIFQQNLFIACEIAQSKQLKENPLWLTVRKKRLQSESSGKTKGKQIQGEEIEAGAGDSHKQEAPINSLSEEMPLSAQSLSIDKRKELTGDDVINFLKENDSGQGCDIDMITEHFGQNIEGTIHTLITMGEVYEIRPGKIKVLE